MTPEITVVMATYRQTKWLPKAVESVLAQPSVKYLIVVVPKEDQKSYSLAGELMIDEGQLRVVPTEYKWKPDMWQQRQYGCEHIPTDYICFFDSDDVMLPGWLEKGLKVAEEIKSRGKIPIVGPSYRMVDEKLSPIQDVILPDFSMAKMMEGSIIPDFSITKTQELRIAFEAGCKVAREQFTPQYSMYCTWLEMLKRFDCEVRLLPDIGFLYRQHKGGMHNRFKKSKRASRKNVEMVHRIARNYFPTGGRDMKQDGTQA
jgi:glycosyltransferase involved in cell wall biosynthesis